MQQVNDKAVVLLPWESIESAAQQQILNTASVPFVFKHVAVMPDCHYGKGATVIAASRRLRRSESRRCCNSPRPRTSRATREHEHR